MRAPKEPLDVQILCLKAVTTKSSTVLGVGKIEEMLGAARRSDWTITSPALSAFAASYIYTALSHTVSTFDDLAGSNSH
jgi:hypothetical protein